MLTLILNDISGVRPSVFILTSESSGIDSTILCTYPSVILRDEGVETSKEAKGLFAIKTLFQRNENCWRLIYLGVQQ